MIVRLVLASASPRRAELLRAAGFAFDVMPTHVDEAPDPEETPDGYARRVALVKAQAVAARAPGRVILGADTIVVVDHEVLGKPLDAEDAKRMLRRLSGREHVVLTAVCLLNPGPAEAGRYEKDVGPAEAGRYGKDVSPADAGSDAGGGSDAGAREGASKRIQTGVARTTVEFAPLSPEEIDWYVASGEPLDKAGAYAVQGLAARFVTRVDGSYSNVVGLPVALVYDLCKKAGLLLS